MRPPPCGYCGFVLGVEMRAMSSSIPYSDEGMHRKHHKRICCSLTLQQAAKCNIMYMWLSMLNCCTLWI